MKNNLMLRQGAALFIIFSMVGFAAHSSAPAVIFLSLQAPLGFAFAGKNNEPVTRRQVPVQPSASARSSKSKKKGQKDPVDPFYGSPLLKKISKRQATRSKRVNYFKKKGAVGEADNGLLKVRSTAGLSKKERQLFNKLVKVENSDRERLFREMEKGSQFSKKNKQGLRRRYFELFRQMDPKGSYFYQADHWQQK